jgi:hypothetical protein
MAGRLSPATVEALPPLAQSGSAAAGGLDYPSAARTRWPSAASRSTGSLE